TQLLVDLVHRAVRRMFEGDGGQNPSAPQVLVVNLSIGDRSRPFDREISTLARLIDWLSWKYRVLFVVSAGNNRDNITLNMAFQDWSALGPGEACSPDSQGDEEFSISAPAVVSSRVDQLSDRRVSA